MEPLYHEQIPSGVAQQLLQDEFIAGSNMSYYLITELQNSVIVQHDNTTGKDTEVALNITDSPIEVSVPRIESYSGEYGAKGLSKFVIIQIAAVGFMLLVVALGIYILYNISR